MRYPNIEAKLLERRQNKMMTDAERNELPWFIRRFRGHYIMLFRDFESMAVKREEEKQALQSLFTEGAAV